jgi:hypothetical protein
MDKISGPRAEITGRKGFGIASVAMAKITTEIINSPAAFVPPSLRCSAWFG